MGQSSNRPTMPPTTEAAFVRDSEQALRSARPLRAFESPIPVGPTSNTRMVTRPSTPAPLRMTDEAWARSMVGVPRVEMALEELKGFHFDHRAGFVLSLTDALVDLETLIDLSGMERDLALELVRGLYEAGVIVFR